MHIPERWPLLLMKVVLAFAFCHQALGYDFAVSGFLTLLALHPLTLSIPGLLSLNAIVKASSLEQAGFILLPLAVLGLLIWIVRDPDASARPSLDPLAGPLSSGT